MKKRRRFSSPSPSEIEITIERKPAIKNEISKPKPSTDENFQMLSDPKPGPIQNGSKQSGSKANSTGVPKRVAPKRAHSTTSSGTNANSMEVEYTGKSSQKHPTCKSTRISVKGVDNCNP